PAARSRRPVRIIASWTAPRSAWPIARCRSSSSSSRSSTRGPTRTRAWLPSRTSCPASVPRTPRTRSCSAWPLAFSMISRRRFLGGAAGAWLVLGPGRLAAAGAVHELAVLAYREAYGGEVRERRFLKQYARKTLADPLVPYRDVRNISGATLSVEATGRAARKAIAVLKVAGTLA